MRQQEQDERQKIQTKLWGAGRIYKHGDTQVVNNCSLCDFLRKKDLICDERHFPLRFCLRLAPDSGLNLTQHAVDFVASTNGIQVRKQQRSIQ